MILKHWLKDLTNGRTNTRSRKAAQKKSSWQAETVEQRLLLSATGYGAEAEIIITSVNESRYVGTGTNSQGQTRQAIEVSYEEIDQYTNAPGAKVTRITIDETVPLGGFGSDNEIFRVTHLPRADNWVEWYRGDRGDSLIKRSTVGSNKQEGQGIDVDLHGTSQVTMILYNNRDDRDVLHRFEFRRLVTSNLTGRLEAPSAVQAGTSGQYNLMLQNQGNVDYLGGGQIEYYQSTSSQADWTSANTQVMSRPIGTSLSATEGRSLSLKFGDLNTPGVNYLHWRINTGEGRDWGPGSGESVLERDSFANVNFPAVCDNEPEPHEIQVNFIPPNRCPVLTVDSRTVVIDEGHLASNAGALFDTDGSVVDSGASTGGFSRNGNRWSWSLQALDGPASSLVGVSGTDDDDCISTESFSLIVNNVAPTMNISPIGSIVEKGIVELRGTYFDPGILDTHTITVDWGDGSDLLQSGVSDGTFRFTHQYLDDNASDEYQIRVTLTDKDGGSTQQTIPVTVMNAAPEVAFDITRRIDENGVALLAGTITDDGCQDDLQLVVDWGDGVTETHEFPAGTTTFQLSHQYLDDGPSPGNGTPEDDYTVTVTVIDDDGGTASDAATVTVVNVDPVIHGIPTFSDPSFLVSGTNDILGLEVADIDQDGDLDLASASRLDNQIAWYSNDGTGNFTKFSLQSLDDGIEVKAGDFDGDGDVDLVASAVDGRQIRLYENDGNQNFTARTLVPGVRGNQLVLVDLDGDSDLDVVWGTQDGAVGWVENLGSAGVVNRGLLSGQGVIREVTVGDVDQDGRTDILVSSRATSATGPSAVHFLRNNGDQSFDQQALKTDVGVVFAGVDSVDIDSDGDIDVVATDETHDQLLIFTNQDGVFSETAIDTDLVGPQIILVTDQDHDGDFDLLISGVNSDSVALFRNDGAGNLTEFIAATGIDGARNILTGDLDGNGIDDIVVDARFADGIASFEYSGERLPKLTAIAEGQTATLSATYLDEGTLDAHTIDVDWGDGQVDSNVTVSGGTFQLSHVYQDDNDDDQYTIHVTLRDDDGGEVSAFTTIAVTNTDPVAEIISVSSLREEGSEITVFSQATDAAGAADILTYTYEVFAAGHPTPVATGGGVDFTSFQFTPADDGFYDIVLTVTDDDGGVAVTSQTIEVDNVGPTIELGDDCVVLEGQTLSLDLTRITDPGDDTISRVLVDWGDGSTESFDSPSVVEHVYEDGHAEFTIKVTLVDEDGTWTGTANRSLAEYSATLQQLGGSIISRYALDADVTDSAGAADGVTVGATQFSTGLIGDAIVVDNGAYGHVQPPNAFVPGNGTFSTSLHFRMEEANAPLNWAPLFVMQQDDFSEGVLFRVSTTETRGDTLSLTLHGGPKGSSDFQEIKAVFDESLFGQWHQAGFRVDRDTGEAAIVLDGEVVGSAPLTVSSLDPTKGIFIGQFDFTFGRNGHPRFVGGDQTLIDDVLIFDTALTDSDFDNLSLTPIEFFHKTVTVENVAPTPSLGAVTGALTEGSVVSISGTASDPAGTYDTLTYHYEVFQAGESTAFDTATGVDLASFEFTPPDDGDYTVVLTVSDEDGGSQSTSKTIAIRNVGPVIDLGEDCVVHEGDVVSLDLTRISDPGDDTISSIIVDWGDGNTETFSSPAVVDHIYPDGPEEFVIQVTLVDEDGTWTEANQNSVSNYLGTLDSLSSTLFARYELDGDILDSAGSADGGTVGNSSFAQGLVGDSLVTSNGNYGWVQPGAAFVPGDNTYSASMHFKLDAMSPPLTWAPLIVTQTSDFSEGALFSVASTNVPGDTLSLALHGGPKGSSDFQVLNFVIEDSLLGQWQQAGYSVDRENGLVSLYLNGQNVETQPLTVSSMDSTRGLFIGQFDFTFGRNGHPRFVGGNDLQIDDVLLFDSTLTESQYDSLTLTGSEPFTKTVVVMNSVPVITEVNSAVIDEDGTAIITGSFTDAGTQDTHEVLVTWGDGTITAALVDPVSRTFTAEHRYLDDDPTTTSSDDYNVELTVTDDDGGVGSADTIVTVNNVVPEFTELMSSHTEFCSASADGIVTIGGSYFDVGTLDTHSVTIDWGDGSPVELITSVDQLADTFTAEHQYLNGGLYTVTVTLTDDDGGVATQTTSATTQGIGLVDGTLYIVGTDGKDNIRLREHHGMIHADVKLDGSWHGWGWFGRYVYQSQSHTQYAAESVTDVFVSLCDGDDHADIWVNSETPIHVLGGAGDDCIYTAGANDTIFGGDGDDFIKSYSGNDIVDGGSGNNRIWSGDGDDFVSSGDGHDWVSAGDGDDVIQVGDGNNTVYGGSGNDVIVAGIGHDCLDGGCGDDHLTSGDGNDLLYGGDGNDVIHSGNGDNCVHAGSGDDTLVTGNGNDWIDGGSGDDLILAGDGDDDVAAGSGNDVVVGGSGDDRIDGGLGTDVIIGGTGSDRLNGGRGDDLLIAGTTIYDDDTNALESIFSEWTSNATYIERVSHLKAGSGSHLNGVNLNAGTTVLGDSDQDILKGNRGRDFFFAASSDRVRDRKRDELWEFLTDA